MAGLVKRLHWSPPEGQAPNDIQCAYVDSLCVYTAKRLRGVKSKEGGKELWHASIKWLRYDCNPPLDVAPQNMRSIILADRRVWYTMNRKAKSTEAGAGMYEGAVKAKAACQAHLNDWAELAVLSNEATYKKPLMNQREWESIGEGHWEWNNGSIVSAHAGPKKRGGGPMSIHVLEILVGDELVFMQEMRGIKNAMLSARHYIGELVDSAADKVSG